MRAAISSQNQADGDSVSVHVGNDHVERPSGGLVEEAIFVEGAVWAEPNVAFAPQRLVRSVGLWHSRAREPLGPHGSVWKALSPDAAGAGREVPGAVVVGLSRLGLPGA